MAPNSLSVAGPSGCVVKSKKTEGKGSTLTIKVKQELLSNLKVRM